MVTDTCVGCGREFEQIGHHLWQSDCEYPNISEHKHDVLKGMLMGDASLYRQQNIPYFQVRMISREFLNYLDGLFSTLGRGVKISRKAEDTEDALSELSPNTKAENCSDVYRWRTMAHPELNEYRSWYDGGKTFPKNLELTPTVLKYWYISDGTIDNEHGSYIYISATNESNNQDKLLSYFESTPIEPTKVDTWGRIQFDKENSLEMLDWIGKPLPGFKYKWEV